MAAEKDVFIQLRATQRQKAQLDALAKARGMTASELVRKWIDGAARRAKKGK